VSVFYQAETWTTRDGRTLRLEEMAPGHRENLLRYLRRNIKGLRFKLELYWLVQVANHDGGDMAHDALEREEHFVSFAKPDELLDSLPLVKRLRWLNRQPYLPTSHLNPILAMFRVSGQSAEEFLPNLDPARLWVLQFHEADEAHATRVLTRLARIQKEAYAYDRFTE
jgi:hypothetical protein